MVLAAFVLLCEAVIAFAGYDKKHPVFIGWRELADRAAPAFALASGVPVVLCLELPFLGVHDGVLRHLRRRGGDDSAGLARHAVLVQRPRTPSVQF